MTTAAKGIRALRLAGVPLVCGGISKWVRKKPYRPLAPLNNNHLLAGTGFDFKSQFDKTGYGFVGNSDPFDPSRCL